MNRQTPEGPHANVFRSNSARPIFVQAMWRTGSTYIWKKFRDQPEYRAYYEPLHEYLIRPREEVVRLCDPATRAALRHPPVDDFYFAEFPFTPGGVQYFRKSLSYERYSLEETEEDSDLERYVANLIAYAARHNQRAVLQFNRALLRAGWLTRHFRPINILLLRQPLNVWKSFARFEGWPFTTTTCLILGQNQHRAPLRNLPHWLDLPFQVAGTFDEECPVYHEFLKANLDKLYPAFFDFFVVSHVHAARFADCILDLDEISTNAAAREQAQSCLRQLGIDIRLDDCSLPPYPPEEADDEWHAYERFALGYLAKNLPGEVSLAVPAFQAHQSSLSPYFQKLLGAFAGRRTRAADDAIRAQEKHKQAITEFTTGQFPQAAETLGAALMDHQTGELWNDWATAQNACQRPQLAELGFRMALRCDPPERQAVGNLGGVLFTKGAYREALPLLEEAELSADEQTRPLLSQLSSRARALSRWDNEETVSCKILLVHEIVPHFDCSGADLRLFELVRELLKQNHRVTLLARSGRDAERYSRPLEELGATVIADDPNRLRHVGDDRITRWNLEDLLERERFDVAILSHWFWMGISVVEHYLNEIRRWSPDTRILVLSEDRHGERERRSFQLTRLLSDLERGNDYERREIEIYKNADLVLYVTETDHRHFASLVPGLPSEHLSTIAESGSAGGSYEERDGLLFLGNFENLANRDAVRWLLDNVWPLLRKEEPELKLYIAGSGGGHDLAGGHPNLVFLGKVDDLGKTFAPRRVFVSPIRYGTGIITKNMIALANGLPVVTTAVGAEGMQLVHGQHAMIADSPREFADSVLRLYRDRELWNTLARQGQEYIASTFSLEQLQSQIRKILARAMRLPPKRPRSPYAWSYRAVEETEADVLTRRPAQYRNMLRTFAYWRAGRTHLDGARPKEALEQFRHIFTTLRGQIPATVLHGQLLKDMARCYRELGDGNAAALCEREMHRLAPVGPTRIPSEPRRTREEKASQPFAPEISVVVPTYNRKDKLRLCLTALAFQSLPSNRWEVVVVDDGSTDGTEAFCRQSPFPFGSFRYFRQANAGAGAARRLGVAQARGELLLLCNDDTIAAPNLLAEHLSVHRQFPSPQLAVLGGFQPSEECNRRALSSWLNWSPFLFPQRNAKPGEIGKGGHFVTCNISIRRAEVVKAGSFDPEFRVGEDTELGARLERRGLRVLYHPEAEAWHDHPEFTTDDLLKRAKVYGRITWMLYRKHRWMLREGKGPFGTLSPGDFSRIEADVEKQRDAFAAAVAGLEALDRIDFLPLLPGTGPQGQKGQEILNLLGQAVPLVFWTRFYESFLEAWKESNERLEEPDPEPPVEART